MQSVLVCMPNVQLHCCKCFGFFFSKQNVLQGAPDDYDDDTMYIVVVLVVLLPFIWVEFKFTILQIGVDMKCRFVAN